MLIPDPSAPRIRPWVDGARLTIGDQSHGLRVLSSKLEGHTYLARVEGRPNVGDASLDAHSQGASRKRCLRPVPQCQ